jgi:hypothetical protein
MFKSPQVASDLLMVSSGHLSWTGNLLSRRQTRIIFLSPHSVIVTSSCALTHVMVTTIPPNGLNLTFPIIAIWLLSPAPTRCSITRSFGGRRPSVIAAPRHSVGPCLVYGNSVSQYTLNSGPLSFFSLIASQSTNNLFQLNDIPPFSNHPSSGSNKYLINSTLSTCPFVISNLLSETCRGCGSTSGAYSTTWKFIDLAWMAILLQLEA